MKKSFLILFGIRLKELRLTQKLSLRQLAMRCNIDYSDISKIEKGQRNIQLTTILELAIGLDIDAHTLFDFDFDLNKCE